MMPLQGKGAHVFHPGGKRARPAPQPNNLAVLPSESPTLSIPSSSAAHTPVATTSQAFAIPLPSAICTLAVLPSSPTFSSNNDNDTTSAPLSTPSSFLQPSDCGTGSSSSVLMSISQGKRKVSALSGSVAGSAGSDASRKCTCGPSMAAMVQVENVEMMKWLSNIVEDISKTLATSGITTNNDVWQHAISALNTRRDEFSSVDDFLDLGRFLTSPTNKQHALLFTGIANPMDCKHLLERYLEEIKRDCAA